MRDTNLTLLRDTALLNTYEQALFVLGRKAPFMGKRNILLSIITGPAPRFFCSIEEALRVCSRMIRGKEPLRKGVRAEMYRDLSGIVVMKMRGNEMHTLRTALMEAIEEPAPRWYLGIETAMRILNSSWKRKKETIDVR